MTRVLQPRTGNRPSAKKFAVVLASAVAVGVLAQFAMSNSVIEPVSQVPSNQVDTVDSQPQWRTVRMRVTAYCECRRCCGRSADGITASGHLIKRGDCFAAADKKYAFGSEVIVPGYNGNQPIQVLDRGGVIKGDRLDVYFASHKKAARWGVKYLDVKIQTQR